MSDNDLVTHLRLYSGRVSREAMAGMMNEAADEIERNGEEIIKLGLYIHTLRTALWQIMECKFPGDTAVIAREALGTTMGEQWWVAAKGDGELVLGPFDKESTARLALSWALRDDLVVTKVGRKTLSKIGDDPNVHVEDIEDTLS